METQSKKKLVYGMLIAFGMNIIIAVILWVIVTIAWHDSLFAFVLSMLPLIFISVTQLIYLLPVISILKRKEEFAMMKGVIIAGVVTALLNGGCWLMFGPI